MDYDLYGIGSLDDILGNENCIKRMRDFSRDVNKGISRMPLLVSGPSGIGKSAAVHMLAMESGWNVVELNASDYRDKESVDRKLLSAATSKTIFGKRNLILLDEIDETAARFDRGAASAIGELMGKSKNPIIFIANDMWDQSISFLRGKVEPVEMKRLMPDTIQRILLNICRRFSIEANRTVVEMIANRANGDARGAINDFSAVMGSDDEEVTEVLGLRDRKIDVFNVLDKIFLTGTISSSLRAIAGTDLENDMLMKWIDENVPRRYRSSSELLSAYESLSYASIFSARAVRSQYYTYWRYMNVLMSGGVALSKTGYPDSARGYSFPKVIKELSGTKSSRSQERAIAAKLQRVFHSSIRRIIKNEMRALSEMMVSLIRENKETEGELRDYLMSAYLIEGKEVDYMLGMAN